ncbi:hypothetical protein AB0F12_14615 [Streptomyces virginiae]
MRGSGTEGGTAIFAGAVFPLFGAAPQAWTGARAGHRAPVERGARPVVVEAAAPLFRRDSGGIPAGLR